MHSPHAPGLWKRSHSPATNSMSPGASSAASLRDAAGDRSLSQIEQGPVSGWRMRVHEKAIWSFSSEACGTLGAVALARQRCLVGAGRRVACRSAASFPQSGPLPLLAAPVSGGNLVRVVHGYALVAGAISGVGVAERRDLPAAVGGVGAAGCVGGADPAAAGGAGRRGAAGLVAGDRRFLAGGGKKGGEKVARTIRGAPGSRLHLVVETSGLPLEILIGPGNENERHYLLPLLDAISNAGMKPQELWADRGYASKAHELALAERQVRSRISQPRRAGDPLPTGVAVREVWRGKKRRLKVADPDVRHRWPVERTNAWLKALRRIATRRDRKADNYLAFLHLGIIVILARAF